MPDSPDWAKFLPGSTRFPLQDLGELAARLGSPVTYDRRGEVVWYDTFDAGISGWTDTGSGAGNDVKAVSALTDRPGFALQLIGGSNANHLAQIFRSFSPATLGRAGIEVSAAFLTDFDTFWFAIYQYTGSKRYNGSIHLSRADGEIQYVDADGNTHKIDDLPNPVNAYGIYMAAKLVVDFETLKYVRLLYNQDEYDLSGIDLHAIDDSSIEHHYIAVTEVARSGSNDYCQLGRVIITGNEP